MFDILVYLYETYYRPEACPNADALMKKLSAVGFEEEDISKALDWLVDLAEATEELFNQPPQQPRFSSGTRIYAKQEFDALGTTAIGFIQFLESARIITPLQREIVIERALAASDEPISREKLKVIVLMVLWSQGKEPDSLIFDEIFLEDDEDDENNEPPLLH